jgi:hypothetical protein
MGVGNFKAFGERIQRFEKKPITLIYGANSIGKSSLLHASLYFRHLQKVGETDLRSTDIFGDELDLGGFTKFVHGRDPERSVEYVLEITDEETRDEVLMRFFGDKASPLAVPWIHETLNRYGVEERRRAIENFLDDEESFRFESKVVEDPTGDRTMEALKKVYGDTFERNGRDRMKSHRLATEKKRDILVDRIERELPIYGETVDYLSSIERMTMKVSIGVKKIVVEYLIDGVSLMVAENDNDEDSYQFDIYANLDHPFAETLWSLVERLNGAKLPPQEHVTYVLAEDETNLVERRYVYFGDIYRKGAVGFRLDDLLFEWGNAPDSKKSGLLDVNLYDEEGEEIEWGEGEASGPEMENAKFWVAEVGDEEWDFANDRLMAGLVSLFCVEISETFKTKETVYVGPLRFYPGRKDVFVKKGFGTRSVLDSEESWYYLEVEEDLRQTVNDWLADKSKLKTPYEIRFRRLYELDESTLEKIREANDGKSSGEILESLDRTEELVIVDKRYGVALNPRDLGLGISQVIPVLIATNRLEGAEIVVEQPELHLHPAVQSELADEFIRSYRERGNELLIETHSEHLLLRIMRRMRQTADGEMEDPSLRLTPDDVSLIFVDTDGERTYLLELRLDDDGSLLDPWPGGFFEEGFRERFS